MKQSDFTKNGPRTQVSHELLFLRQGAFYEYLAVSLLKDVHVCRFLAFLHDELVGLELPRLYVVKKKVINFRHPCKYRMLLDHIKEEMLGH